MNSFRRFVLVLTILATTPELMGCNGELRLLQIVFHNGGHRVPDPELPPRHPPYRPSSSSFWQSGPGKIALIGMVQLFRLGQTVRRKYGDFVTLPTDEVDDLQPSERGVPCGSLSKCFMSGFYRPNKDHPPPTGDVAWQLQNELPPGGSDKPTEPELMCPRLREEASSRLYDDSDEGNRIVGEHANLYQYWSSNSGREIKNPTDARELYENLQLEKGLNLSVPPWADRFWPELKHQSDIHFGWLAKDRNLQRMAAGPLLGLMIHRMELHVDGHDAKKYFVYSGKNSSLAGLLAIFGNFDGVEPAFGSTVVLELHKFGTVYYVRVLHFYSSGVHANAPEVVTLGGCSEYCPFHRFKLLTTGMVPVRWQHECGLWKEGRSPRTNPFRVAGLLCLLFVMCSY